MSVAIIDSLHRLPNQFNAVDDVNRFVAFSVREYQSRSSDAFFVGGNEFSSLDLWRIVKPLIRDKSKSASLLYRPPFKS